MKWKQVILHIITKMAIFLLIFYVYILMIAKINEILRKNSTTLNQVFQGGSFIFQIQNH